MPPAGHITRRAAADAAGIHVSLPAAVSATGRLAARRPREPRAADGRRPAAARPASSTARPWVAQTLTQTALSHKRARPQLRALNIVVRLGTYFGCLWYDRVTGAEDTPDRVRLRAQQLRDMLTVLGPSFIKAGQVLANRPDIVREDYMNELCVLQVGGSGA